MIAWFIDCFIDCLLCWSIHWLLQWLIYWLLIDSLIDWFLDCLLHCFIDWFLHSLLYVFVQAKDFPIRPIDIPKRRDVFGNFHPRAVMELIYVDIRRKNSRDYHNYGTTIDHPFIIYYGFLTAWFINGRAIIAQALMEDQCEKSIILAGSAKSTDWPNKFRHLTVHYCYLSVCYWKSPCYEYVNPRFYHL